jgi:hypothetical protein
VESEAEFRTERRTTTIVGSEASRNGSVLFRYWIGKVLPMPYRESTPSAMPVSSPRGPGALRSARVREKSGIDFPVRSPEYNNSHGGYYGADDRDG